MIPALQILALLTVSMAMALALAHALEFPGKLRLSRTEYETVQEIYYPGFTYGGAGEGIPLLLLLVLLLAGPWQCTTFWLTLAAWLTLIVVHGVNWTLIHPINSFWLKELKGFGALLRICRPQEIRALAGLDGIARPLGVRACRTSPPGLLALAFLAASLVL